MNTLQREPNVEKVEKMIHSNQEKSLIEEMSDTTGRSYSD